MKIISECTEVISSSDDRKIIVYKILTNDGGKNETFTTSENDVNDVNDAYKLIENCISRFNNPGEELSQTSTNFIFNFENQNPRVNHLNEPSIVDKFVKKNSSCVVQTQITDLDEAFKSCIIKIHGDLSSRSNDIINELIEIKNEDGSTSEIIANLSNPKRKVLLPNEDDSCSSYDITYDNLFFNGTNKYQSIENSVDVLKQNLQLRQEITVDVPKFLEQYKYTLETFLQKHVCLILPTIDKCIECRVHQMKNHITSDNDYDNIICRFYAFRQLKFTESGTLVVAGYPDPYTNIISTADMGLWLPSPNLSIPHKINIEASMKILEDTGGQFCRFVEDEKEALELNWTNEQEKRKIVWKKCVNGVREMCDVCKTSIFNHHWSCGKCGFVVCVDCFRNKLEGNNKFAAVSSVRKCGKKMWLPCTDQIEHQVDQLSMTQILAGDSLYHVSSLMHEICILHNIPLDCGCIQKSRHNSSVTFDIESIYDLTFKNKLECYYSDDDDDYDDYKDKSRLSSSITKNYSEYCKLNNKTMNKNYSECCGSNIRAKAVKIEVQNKNSILRQNMESFNFRNIQYTRRKNMSPKLSLSFSNTIGSYTWLCEGHLLFLLNSKSYDNYEIFQEQWKRGQPVLARGVGNSLNPLLWHPESFSRDFGSQNNDLINCITGEVVSNQPMYKFWEGFENASARLRNKYGQPMLLKLKDWPPSADFAETLPDRFQDLMNCLPLKEYTQRNGKFNLAARLPECFVPPDLGPKMYTAYGNADTKFKKVGTTNLHLDISDAVNVMVYVAITKNCYEYDYDWHVRKASQAIEEAGCDDLTKRRVFVHGEIPGALWHIYHASDADCIRDLLIRVAVEQGDPLEQYSDPIHDQSYYLDEYLRERLYKEYGVKGYAIVQCYGDAIFIPAGAPHQVKNLHNCIKVAEDFVSPENIHQSFRMTQEFRNLTDSHTNHEDKLQIKNIVYHAVKDSISVLKYHHEL